MTIADDFRRRSPVKNRRKRRNLQNRRREVDANGLVAGDGLFPDPSLRQKPRHQGRIERKIAKDQRLLPHPLDSHIPSMRRLGYHVSHDPMSIRIPITLGPDATLPAYQTAGAAGMDLCSAIDFELAPMERLLVPTDIKIAIPAGYEGQVRPRSGLAVRHGIGMVNTPGTIDCDYRGEIKVLLINLGQDAVTFQKGDRVAQLVICPVVRAELHIETTLEETERGVGGFGSTGKN